MMKEMTYGSQLSLDNCPIVWAGFNTMMILRIYDNVVGRSFVIEHLCLSNWHIVLFIPLIIFCKYEKVYIYSKVLISITFIHYYIYFKVNRWEGNGTLTSFQICHMLINIVLQHMLQVFIQAKPFS